MEILMVAISVMVQVFISITMVIFTLEFGKIMP